MLTQVGDEHTTISQSTVLPHGLDMHVSVVGMVCSSCKHKTGAHIYFETTNKCSMNINDPFSSLHKFTMVSS